MSIKKIAENLNLSTATVSYVLSGKGDKNNIPSETQVRILNFARKINYKTNQLAKSLSTGKSNIIGLIISDLGNMYYSKMAKSIEEELRKVGYELMVVSSNEEPERESEIIQMMKERQVDGMIISSTGYNKEDIKSLRDANYPLVLIDRRYIALKTNQVQSEIFQGAYKLINHLCDLKYKKIGVVTTLNHLPSMSERINAYKQVLKEHGISYNANLVKEVPFDSDLTSIKKVIAELMVIPNAIDALYVTNNKLTILCYEAMRDLNIRIPYDCAFVSFDDMDYFKYLTPPITAVKQDVEEMGRSAVNMLISDIEEDANKPKKWKTLNLEMKLNVRSSCGAIIKREII